MITSQTHPCRRGTRQVSGGLAEAPSPSKQRPVYVAQCKTFAVALGLYGIKLAPGEGRATYLGDQSPLTLFRALRPYRSQAANQLRADVARIVRRNRSVERSSN